VSNDNEKNLLPPLPENVPEAPAGLPPGMPAGDPIAVQIDIETYKQLMAILQELPYRISGQVMNKLAPGVKAIYETPPEKIDDPDGESAE
jgi:hypothetical protein